MSKPSTFICALCVMSAAVGVVEAADPMAWTGAQAQTEAAVVARVGSFFDALDTVVSTAQINQAKANYDAWNSTCNNGTLFPVYKCLKPDGSECHDDPKCKSQSQCETNVDSAECWDPVNSATKGSCGNPSSTCTQGTCGSGGTCNGAENDPSYPDEATCVSDSKTWVNSTAVWTQYVWNVTSYSAWTSQTRCRLNHDSVKDQCCNDGNFGCGMDASGETLTNAGMFKCANKCMPGDSEYSAPTPSWCDPSTIASDKAAVRAGTKARADGFSAAEQPVVICPIVPNCGTCMNNSEYEFKNRGKEQSECEDGSNERGKCTWADGSPVEATSVSGKSACEGKGQCSTDVDADNPTNWMPSTSSECATKGKCKRPSDGSDQGIPNDQSSCTGNCIVNDSDNTNPFGDNATCISQGNCSVAWAGGHNFQASDCNGTFTPNVWAPDVWHAGVFTPMTWVNAKFVKNGYTSEATCESFANGGTKCFTCNDTRCASSIDSCLSCTYDPYAILVDNSATYTNKSACESAANHWKEEVNKWDKTTVKGFPLNGLASNGTGTTTSSCNSNLGGKISFSGNLEEGLLSNIGFTNGGFIKDTLLMSDLRVGTTAAAAYAANKTYYDRIMTWKAASNAVLADMPVTAAAGTVPAEAELKLSGVAVFSFPKVAGKFATAACSGAECNTDSLHGATLTAADLHLIALDPMIYSSSDPSVGLVVTNGAVTVHGGENRGKIVASTTGAVRLYGMTNGPTGDITASNSQDIFVVSTTNQGKLSVSNVAAGLYDVTSSGTIQCDGCKAKAWKTTNTGTITITGAADMTLADSSNAGTITIDATGGTFKISGSNNTATGTINVTAGRIEADNVCNTGTVTLAAGVTGYINYASACSGTINGPAAAAFNVSDGSTSPAPTPADDGSTSPAPTPADDGASGELSGAAGIAPWRVAARTAMAMMAMAGASLAMV